MDYTDVTDVIKYHDRQRHLLTRHLGDTPATREADGQDVVANKNNYFESKFRSMATLKKEKS